MDQAERNKWLQRRLHAAAAAGSQYERSRALLAMMKDMGPEDFKVVLAMSAADFPSIHTDLDQVLMNGWVACDPAAALAFAGQDAFCQMLVVGPWADKDPEGALKWLGAHPNVNDGGLTERVARQLVGQDPSRAGEVLASVGGDRLGTAMREILALGNPVATAAVVKWAGGLTDPAALRTALNGLYYGWQGADSPAIFNLLLSHPEVMLPESLGERFQVWAKADTNQAMQAVEQLPEGALRTSALQGVLAQIATNGDLAEVGALLESHADEMNDDVLGVWTSRLFRADPSSAMQQIGQLRDPAIRQVMYESYLTSWVKQDQAAAVEWMKRNPESVNDDLRKRYDYEVKKAASAAGR